MPDDTPQTAAPEAQPDPDRAWSPDAEAPAADSAPEAPTYRHLLDDADIEEPVSGTEKDGFTGGAVPPNAMRVKLDKPIEGLPASMMDAESGELLVDRLVDNWKGLRKAVSARGEKMPETADSYFKDLKFGDPAAATLWEQVEKDDPLMQGAAELAFKHGVRPAFMRDLTELYLTQGAAALGDAAKPIDTAEELRRLGPEAKTVIRELAQFRRDMLDSGSWSDDDAFEFDVMTATAQGAKAFRKVMERMMMVKELPATHAASVAKSDSVQGLLAKQSELTRKLNTAKGSEVTAVERQLTALRRQLERAFAEQGA